MRWHRGWACGWALWLVAMFSVRTFALYGVCLVWGIVDLQRLESEYPEERVWPLSAATSVS